MGASSDNGWSPRRRLPRTIEVETLRTRPSSPSARPATDPHATSEPTADKRAERGPDSAPASVIPRSVRSEGVPVSVSAPASVGPRSVRLDGPPESSPASSRWNDAGPESSRSSGPSSRRSGGRRAPVLPVTARNIAAEVLSRVERDDAFAAAVLDHELKRSAQLSARDRAMTTELVYGTLRLRPLLERSIETVTPRGIAALDPKTRAILLVAAYQLHYTRVPAFAAVSEAVAAVRTLRGRALAGFANGALRQLSSVVETAPLPKLPTAFRDATAPWLRRALERSIGEDATEALLTAGPFPPPLNLRVRVPGFASLEEARQTWIERIRAAVPNAKVESCALAPGAIALRGAGSPHDLPGYAEGAWTIQEEGAQIIGHLLGARAGETILDACAGRGNKSTQLADSLRENDGSVRGRVDVADLHIDKLTRLSAEFARMELPRPLTYGVDWSVGCGEVPERAYDRVLVDAPCSGTGTIRRRPEIQTRRQAADLPSLATGQAKILGHASAAVRPGGRLVYAVCSVLRDECEGVVQAFLDTHQDFVACPFDVPLAGQVFAPDATAGRLLTHVHATDAYYVASFERRA